MRYVVWPDGTKYCVEVERGWIGKPVLSYPPEFLAMTDDSPDLVLAFTMTSNQSLQPTALWRCTSMSILRGAIARGLGSAN
jgi:hypothetical protein